MIMDPAGHHHHHHHHHHMPRPFLRQQHDEQAAYNHGSHSSSSASKSSAAGAVNPRHDTPHGGTPPPPLGSHHFHAPPPSGWIERQQQHQQPSRSSTPSSSSTNSSISSAASNNNPPVPRRSPRGSPASLRFDGGSFPPVLHHNMHPRHLGGPPSAAGGAGGQRGMPSPRSRPVGAAGRGPPPPMRPLPQNVGGVGGPCRRPEHLMVGPLGDPMFGGSPGTCGGGMGLGGGGGGGGEGGSLGMETVSRVLIPNCKIGAVIGKGGAIIKHIREVSGAKVTISDSCTGLHDDSDDRMVTAAGTFNSVQLAFTHILSHAGAVGPDADPVMGLAGGDPDCVANSFRLLIPNVKAGGLIGRGGCTIKAIREQSGARIEISSHAFHFHPVHGPLPTPLHHPPTPQAGGAGGGGPQSSSIHGGLPNGDGGPRGSGGGGPGVGGSNNNNGFGGGGGPAEREGGPPAGIPLPLPMLMDRVMTAMGSFDA
ncbi:unnamed protein product, partial [Ectocarpus sp. 4 AP-2014]